MTGNKSAKTVRSSSPAPAPDNRPLAISYLRLSTGAQLKGHGRQRQLELSADYAARHGYELADDALYEDIGVSAFKGANVREGALGRLLAAIKAGTIPVATRRVVVLVESLDRLSREEIQKSASLFLDIINSGIWVADIHEDREYGPGVRFEDLLIPLSKLSRGHEESLTKSKRVSAAWANKRAQAASKKLTAMAPKWLKPIYDDDDKLLGFEKIRERVRVVQKIFEDTVAGMGTYVIASRLNREKKPTFGLGFRKDATVGKGWHRSSVARIVTNRAVLGEFQPGKMVDGKREEDGDPIKNYFPVIIKEDLFNRAQQARSQRRVSGAGRKGEYVTNLFSGLARCLYCGGRTVFHGKGPPRGMYLFCEAARRGMGCGITTGWRYDQFEASFLAFVNQLDLPSLVRDNDSQIKTKDESVQALEGKRIAKQAEMEKAWELQQSAPIEFVANKLVELQKQLDEIKASLEAEKAELQVLRLSETAFYENKAEIKSLVEKLQVQSSRAPDLYKLRSSLAARIKALVAELKIAPVGDGPIMAKKIEFYEAQHWGSLDPNVTGAEFKRKVMNALKAEADNRYFKVTFKNGGSLSVMPSREDPLILKFKSEWELVGST